MDRWSICGQSVFPGTGSSYSYAHTPMLCKLWGALKAKVLIAPMYRWEYWVCP